LFTSKDRAFFVSDGGLNFALKALMVIAGLKNRLVLSAFLLFAPLFAYGQSAWTVDNTWLNVPIQSNTGAFSSQFDVTPSATGLDGIVGFSDGAATGYTSLAAIVRFNSSSLIDARNAGTYSAATPVSYAANVTYHFRLQIDVASRSYSIYVTPAGGTEQLIGADYRFRSEQSSVARLNNFTGHLDGSGSLTVAALTLNGGSVNQAPTVQITSPASSASFTAPASITISANAADSDGTVSRVDFYNGTTLLGSDSTSPFSLTLNNTAAGTLQLTARATDNSGAISTSTPVNVTVNAAPPVGTSSVELAWDPSTSPDVVDYRVYVGSAPGAYFRSSRVGNVTRHTVTDLLPGTTYYFAVTAISRVELESEFSNTVSGQIDLPAPALSGGIVSGSFQLSSQGTPSKTYIVDQSEDLRQWTTAATVSADAQGRFVFRNDPVGPHKFFRVREQ
jgi:hypothetical protein